MHDLAFARERRAEALIGRMILEWGRFEHSMVSHMTSLLRWFADLERVGGSGLSPLPIQPSDMPTRRFNRFQDERSAYRQIILAADPSGKFTSRFDRIIGVVTKLKYLRDDLGHAIVMVRPFERDAFKEITILPGSDGPLRYVEKRDKEWIRMYDFDLDWLERQIIILHDHGVRLTELYIDVRWQIDAMMAEALKRGDQPL